MKGTALKNFIVQLASLFYLIFSKMLESDFKQQTI